MNQRQRQTATDSARGTRRAALGTAVVFGAYGRPGQAQDILDRWQRGGGKVTGSIADPDTGNGLFMLDYSGLDGDDVLKG